MKIGLVGLGTMGSQIAERLLKNDHNVLVDNRKPQRTQKFVDMGAQKYQDYSDMIDQLGDRPVVWLMIPHKVVSEVLAELSEMLPPKSILVDGGNSDFRSTRQQAKICHDKQIQFVDVGTSGGVWGLEGGFSMMVGGDKQAVDHLRPVFETLAQHEGWAHFGPSGAGHFVKMVHNAIEYGLMQSFAEGYRLIKEGPYQDVDMAEVAKVWQHGSINQSFLNGLIQGMLEQDPHFSDIDGVVAESGETRWALEVADEMDVAMPAIRQSFQVRLDSQQGKTNYATKFLARLRNAFGGHDINPHR